MGKEEKLLELIQKSGKISRRTLLKGAGSLAVLLSLPIDLRSAFAAGTGASAAPDHVTLTWSSDPTTTQTIAWRTDTSVTNGVIQYTQAPLTARAGAVTNWTNSATAALETLRTDIGDANLHAGMLSGLSSGTKYTYRVGDGTTWSNAATFTTASAGTNYFKFLIFGDSQSGITGTPEYTPWKNNVHAAFAANPDARFFVNVGDLTECGQYYTHWNNWHAACQDIINTIPSMPSQGNHETYNNGWVPPSGAKSEPYEYVEQFKLPQNGPQSLRTQAYSWDYGNVHFVVMDSQYDEEVTAETGTVRFPGSASTLSNPLANPFISAQVAWLDNDLKNTNKQWKVVIFHKTPYYNKASRSNEIIKAAYIPTFDKYHVDVVFNGHDHGISRTYPIKGDVFQSSPANGTIYYVTGRSGNKYYTDLSRKVWDQFLFDANDMPCYITAQVNGSSLTLTAVKQNGAVIDTYTINKASGTDSPRTILPRPYATTRVILYGNDSGVDAWKNGSTWYVPLDFVKTSYTNSYAGATYNAGSYTGGTPIYTLVNPSAFTSDSTHASFSYSSVNYTFTVGSTTVGGTTKTLSSPAILQNGMLMITANDITNLFGFSYRYDSSLNAIFIVK